MQAPHDDDFGGRRGARRGGGREREPGVLAGGIQRWDNTAGNTAEIQPKTGKLLRAGKLVRVDMQEARKARRVHCERDGVKPIGEKIKSVSDRSGPFPNRGNKIFFEQRK